MSNIWDKLGIRGPKGEPGAHGAMGLDGTRIRLSYNRCHFCEKDNECTLWIRYEVCMRCEMKLINRLKAILNFE